MDRAQRLLAGLLAAQLLLLALFHNPFASRRAAADQPLLPGLASITPEKLEIDGGQGTSVILEREGGAWALGQPKGYPVTPGKVEKVIQDLEHLNVHRQVVSGSRYHAALKVAPNDFERRVRIWEKPGGNPRAELYVGSSPSYGVSHVRVGGNDRVYEASGINSFDLPAEPASWVERNLVPIANQDVTRFELANRKGSFALEKQGATWTVRSPASRSNTALDQDKPRRPRARRAGGPGGRAGSGPHGPGSDGVARARGHEGRQRRRAGHARSGGGARRGHDQDRRAGRGQAGPALRHPLGSWLRRVGRQVRIRPGARRGARGSGEEAGGAPGGARGFPQVAPAAAGDSPSVVAARPPMPPGGAGTGRAA